MSTQDIYDLVVVGGGPAGLAAAIYGGRANLKTVLLERGATGGQAATTFRVENYPGFPDGVGGPELMQMMEEQAKAFGAEVTFGEVQGIRMERSASHGAESCGQAGDGPGGAHVSSGASIGIDSSESAIEWMGPFVVASTSGEIRGKTVIIATGTEPARLGVPGETELRGRGVSYCATCDGAFFRDKSVVVVGGGDSAIEEAIFLTRFAKTVMVVHRRDVLRATKILQQRAFDNPKIQFAWNSVVTTIVGTNKVEGVRLRNTKDGSERDLLADGVFIYVGSRPNTEFLKGFLSLSAQGYIVTDERMRTQIGGIFAAGDVRQKTLRQIVTAVSDGAIAAVEAEKLIAH
ncbi:MAG: FAD-dependent oxidoreductase [Firmicutes bacterium]|nr:FAD-dependent oxidoreductase [Bacillota bacterium]